MPEALATTAPARPPSAVRAPLVHAGTMTARSLRISRRNTDALVTSLMLHCW
ncbi:hypothetical protein OG322_16415 [Streptomyces sp. NBC_01260]|uniref:hypothetical protein n=1 Tax=unclassified Streptomyces TaxID=2593676 RepID=UPI000F9F9922|nr:MULTISPECIES: hypothetical protein [unclassified Streptomyces]MCX4770950.1 hypothetical protein [Streptomyces sp. NBC_01285]ROQ81677.1 hypothetical protein EDD95_1267 [Streptomyces sp. CEV 2-1]